MESPAKKQRPIVQHPALYHAWLQAQNPDHVGAQIEGRQVRVGIQAQMEGRAASHQPL